MANEPAVPTLVMHCFAVTVGHTAHKPVHTHREHEFYLCVGRPGRQYTDTHEFAMKEGDLFLFPAGQPHYASAPPASATDGLVLNMSQSLLSADREGERDLVAALDALAAAARRGENKIPLTKKTAAKVRFVMADIDRERSERAPGYRTAIRLGVQRFLLVLLRDPHTLAAVGNELAAAPAGERLADVLRMIEFRYMDPLTVEHAARVSSLSRSRFHELFRQRVGSTFVEYLTGVRVKAAERMLAESDAKIIDVAYSCGFPSLSHFYHVFGRATGRTPCEVRRKRRTLPAHRAGAVIVAGARPR
jgi:AraC-like DNA-binding protein/uncharacterized RmlC-like cupin family protein